MSVNEESKPKMYLVHAEAQKPYRNAAFSLIVLVTAARVFWASAVDLSPDEAYYWYWSLKPSWGYMDHPPMIAWFIGVCSRSIPGELGVRLPALLAGALTQVLVYRMCTRLWGSARWGLAAVIAVNSTVLFSAGASLSTPDAPLILFWVAAMYVLANAFDKGGPVHWIGAGAVSGLALQSKYTAGLFGLAAVVYVVSSSKRMQVLKRPGPYLGMAAAALVFLPNVLWNASHGFVTIGFQASHVIRESGTGLGRNLGEFLAGQALLVNPIIFCAAVFASMSRRLYKAAGESAVFFAYFFGVPFLFFLALGCAKRLEANWPAVAWPAGMVLVVGLYKNLLASRTMAKPARMLAWLGTAMGLTMVVTAHVHAVSPFLPTPAKSDPTARLRGWHELADDVADMRSNVQAGRLPLYTRRYQEASIIGFYDRAHSMPRAFGPGWRQSQFDLAEDVVRFEDPALILWESGLELPAKLAPRKRLKKIGRIQRTDRGVVLAVYDLYLRIPAR